MKQLKVTADYTDVTLATKDHVDTREHRVNLSTISLSSTPCSSGTLGHEEEEEVTLAWG